MGIPNIYLSRYLPNIYQHNNIVVLKLAALEDRIALLLC